MSKVLIWGTGTFADVFISVFKKFINVYGYVESNPNSYIHNDLKVYSPREILDIECDHILVVNTHYDEIVSLCKEKDIDITHKLINVFEKKIGIYGDNEIKLDFTGINCSDGWITWNKLLLCTNNATVYRELVQQDNFADWWSDVDNNVILASSNQLQMHMEKAINEWIIPQMNKTQIVLDIGCSSGIMDEKISPFCHYIDAYDYSEASINEAKKRANEFGIKNINYDVADAKMISLNKQYDIAFLLGLTVCFENDDDVQKVINNVNRALKQHGKVLLKDSLNIISDNNIYHCNFNTNYQACYRPIDVYEKMWENSGFSIIRKEVLADDLNIGMVKKYSMGYLLEKM